MRPPSNLGPILLPTSTAAAHPRSEELAALPGGSGLQQLRAHGSQGAGLRSLGAGMVMPKGETEQHGPRTRLRAVGRLEDHWPPPTGT